MIYLDNAATTLHKPPQVARAMVDALSSMGNSGRGTHASGLCAARTIYAARERLAGLLGCSRADHVVFTSNATEALNLAIYGLLREGDHVISTDLEHNSVLRPLYRMQAERGVELDFLPTDAWGNPDYDKLAEQIRPNTRAIICTHASNVTGNVVDLETVRAICRGRLLIVDAAQTAGTRPIHMEKLGIDVLCFTGHKGLMGPQGTGGLCVREGLELQPFKVGGSGVQSYLRTQPKEFPTCLEAGTLNAHGIAGLLAAVEYIQEVGVETIQAKEAALTRRFYEGVRDLPGVRVYGDFRGDHAAIVSLNVRDFESGAVSDALSEEYDIATRPGAHCAPRMHQALGTREQGAVRFSFAWYNTQEEVDQAIRAIWELSTE